MKSSRHFLFQHLFGFFYHSTSEFPTMRAIFVFLFIFVLVSSGTSVPQTGRIFGNIFAGIFSPCTGCPIRKCLNDKAVILGYCCGCARVSDFLPIDCPGLHLNCPVDGRRLCRDYDYMLNCCCP